MWAASRSPQELLGRRGECRIVEDVVAAVRSDRSAVLVVRGEPGIGKTALLQYAERTAADWMIAKAAGVEGETELAYGGLHQLCSPFLVAVDLLAVDPAFAVIASDHPDMVLRGEPG
jgi:hypothetical protein